jgi:hypothetical protein
MNARASTRRPTSALLSVACVIAIAGAFSCRRPPAPPGACANLAMNVCTQYGAKQARAAKRMCGAAPWLEGEDACPRDGALGRCVRERGAYTEWLYAGPPNRYTAEAARRTCKESGGAFSEP